MKKISFTLLGILTLHNSIASFNTLTDLKAHAKNLPEYPKADNNNWNDPVYSSFYESIIPGRIGRILEYFGWKSQSWNSSAFEKELLKTVESRERKNLSGRQVAKLILDQPTTLYIFGDVQGHFHSLMRSLNFLLEQQIINDHLEIISPDTYIIFNGDFVDRSAYSLECLYLVMLMLNRNPENCFYIRGKHEDKDYWQNFGLNRELRQRAASLLPANSPANAIPLGDLIHRFFESLPLALYVAKKNDPLELIRISHTGRDNPELKEELFNTFFVDNLDKKISYFDVRRKEKSKTAPHIKALITTEDWLKEHRSQKGLGVLDQDLGTSAWAIISTPIMAYQKYYDFHFDAFAEIKITDSIQSSIITLWNNNINGPTQFTRQRSYRLATSMPLDKETNIKPDLPDIKIGSTIPLNRDIAIMGQRIKRGIDIRVNQENQIGGIDGQHISTIIYNDDNVPFLARQNINKLMHVDDIRLILIPIGSQTLMSYIDYIKSNQITVLFPLNGISEFRVPELTSLINYRPTYQDEIEILLNHLFTDYGARKFLFFYQNDAYGQDALRHAHADLKARGITDWIDVPYARGETNFKKQADIIKNAQIDTIGFFSNAKPTAELVRQIGVEALSNKKMFGLSPLGEISFREFIKTQGLQIMLSAVVPNPATSNLEAAVLYRKAMDENKLPYDIFSLEAFLTTSILIEVMHRIKGPVTREKIMEKMESFYDDKFQGLTLTFNPQTRSLARYVWIETGEDENWIERKIKNTLN